MRHTSSSRETDETLFAIILQVPATSAPIASPLRIDSAAALRPLAEQSSASDTSAWLILYGADDQLSEDAPQRIHSAIKSALNIGWLITDAAYGITADSADLHPIFQPDPGAFLLRSGFSPKGAIAVRASLLATVLAGRTPASLRDWRRWLVLSLLGAGMHFLHLAEILLSHPASRTSESVADTSAETTPTSEAVTTRPNMVSIVIPTRDQFASLQRCLESLLQYEPGCAFEIILVSHHCDDPVANNFINGLPDALPGKLRVTRVDAPFNFARLCNAGAVMAQGDFLLFMNDDVAALHSGWLAELLQPMSCAEVGVSAPRLVFPDGRIQHAGMVLGLNGAADFPCLGYPMDDPGPLGLLAYTREVSAVTGACMLVRRTLFEDLKGFNTDFTLAYADVDLCIRTTQSGQFCIWTPHATLMHEAGRTLKSTFATPDAAAVAQAHFDHDKALLVKRWLPVLARDPYYNPNLSLTSRRFEPELNPALQPFNTTEPTYPRILALPADDSGSGEYRVGMPARAAALKRMAASRIASGYPLPVLVERLGIHTLFSQRQVDDNQFQALANLRELLPTLRIVMDFDDLLTEVSPHSYYHQTVWKDMPRRLQTLGKLSDCLTASTAPLAEAMRAYHADIRHVPNGIDPARWPGAPDKPPSTGKLRVGWVGGLSHAADLAIVRAVIAQLANEVDWVFLGMCLEDIRPHLREFTPAVPFADYPAQFAALNLDLAIAPLEISAFNECKSNLRLLENGILGIPVIATDITPYQCGLPVTLVDNRQQTWIRAIRERIGEREALRRDGIALRNAVLRNWTLEQTLPAWVSAWAG